MPEKQESAGTAEGTAALVAVVAAILSVTYRLADANFIKQGFRPQPTENQDETALDAYELVRAARARVRMSEEDSEPDAMPKNAEKYQHPLSEADMREVDLAQRFLRRVGELRASPEGRTTTVGEVYDEVYRGGVGATEPDRMRKNTGKHPEKSENREKSEKPEVAVPPGERWPVVPGMAEAVAKVFWEEIQGVPWDRSRYGTAARYAETARKALDAAVDAAVDAARKAGA